MLFWQSLKIILKDVYNDGENEFLSKRSAENLIFDETGNVTGIRFVYPIVWFENLFKSKFKIILKQQ